MRLRLESKWTDRLLKFPESGMGNQRVRVKLTSGRVIEPAVVLNAEMLELLAALARACEARTLAPVIVAPSDAILFRMEQMGF